MFGAGPEPESFEVPAVQAASQAAVVDEGEEAEEEPAEDASEED
jgi:hypothetical protein